MMSLPLPFRIFPAFYCQWPGTLGTKSRKPGSFTGGRERKGGEKVVSVCCDGAVLNESFGLFKKRKTKKRIITKIEEPPGNSGNRTQYVAVRENVCSGLL